MPRGTRRRTKPRLGVSPFIVVVLIGLAVAGAIAWKISDHGPDPEPKTPEPVETTVTKVVEPKEVKRAREVKPLQDTLPGDRLLYDAVDDRPVCIFKEWFGDMTQARIECPDMPVLTVLTVYLTAVETEGSP